MSRYAMPVPQRTHAFSLPSSPWQHRKLAASTPPPCIMDSFHRLAWVRWPLMRRLNGWERGNSLLNGNTHESINRGGRLLTDLALYLFVSGAKIEAHAPVLYPPLAQTGIPSTGLSCAMGYKCLDFILYFCVTNKQLPFHRLLNWKHRKHSAGSKEGLASDIEWNIFIRNKNWPPQAVS